VKLAIHKKVIKNKLLCCQFFKNKKLEKGDIYLKIEFYLDQVPGKSTALNNYHNIQGKGCMNRFNNNVDLSKNN